MHPLCQLRTCRHWYLPLHTGLMLGVQSPGSDKSCGAQRRSCWVQTRCLCPRAPPALSCIQRLRDAASGRRQLSPSLEVPVVPGQGGLSVEERSFPWPREAEGDAGQEPGRGELRPKNGRFLMGGGTLNGWLGLALPLQERGSEGLPSALCRARHGAWLGKGWNRTGRVAQAG